MAGLGLLALSLVLPGCGGSLVRLAKRGDWEAVAREGRAMKAPPRDRAARAFAQALVELGEVDEARAVLLRDFRKGGHEASLLALADLERSLGLTGMATAHYVRLASLDLDDVQTAASAPEVCVLLEARARAEARLDQALAADLDMRRMALVCPDAIGEAQRDFMASLRPAAEAEVRAQRTLAPLEPSAPERAVLEQTLDERLQVARRRNPRAVMNLAAAEGMQLSPEDVAMLLAAEFTGGLGPGMVSSRRLSSWIGSSDPQAVVKAIEGLPAGVREYALLRLSGVRGDDIDAGARQGWIVTAMATLDGEGPQEAAKAWRVAAVAGDLSGAEFALTTNLRDLIPPVEPTPAGTGEVPKPMGTGSPWALRVPVDRRSFDLLLTLARLLELRGDAALALT
ncbi:MAG: hypothetical protein KC431_01760, partial [Myxococcales bacterium]|nr:hypothetical protein [Myxococcales bacterium]